MEQELAQLDDGRPVQVSPSPLQPGVQADVEGGRAERPAGQDNPGFEGPAAAVPVVPKGKEQHGWVNNAIDRGCKENSWFGKKCLKMFKVPT